MPAAANWLARSRIHFRAPSVMTGDTESISSQSPSVASLAQVVVSVSVTELGALDRQAGERPRRSLGLDAERGAGPVVVVGPHAGELR